jgi:probable FeS assembly SUF system protein SufT
MPEEEFVILKRDCDAVLIPSGDRIKLLAGEPVSITQALGGSFTVIIHGNMARVDAANAEALGKQTATADANGDEPLSEEAVYKVLRTCYDPEIPVNIVDLGLIYDLQITPTTEGGSRVDVKMTLTAPGCGMGPILQQDVVEKINRLPGVKETEVELVWDPPWNRQMLSEAARLELGLM